MNIHVDFTTPTLDRWGRLSGAWNHKVCLGRTFPTTLTSGATSFQITIEHGILALLFMLSTSWFNNCYSNYLPSKYLHIDANIINCCAIKVSRCERPTSNACSFFDPIHILTIYLEFISRLDKAATSKNRLVSSIMIKGVFSNITHPKTEARMAKACASERPAHKTSTFGHGGER